MVRRDCGFEARDSLGNPVHDKLIEAAHRVWERARLVVIRYLAEDTEAPEILEAIVDAASRTGANNQSMQLFEAYLLTSVARESVRRRRRNQRIAYMDPADIERFSATVSMNLDRQLDDAKRIEVFRACMDEQGRMMYDLRVLDYDWRAAPATPIQTLTHDDLFRLYEAQQAQQRPPQPVLKKEIHHDVTRNDTGLEIGR